MIRAHKITLKLNNKQRTYMAKSAGCARFAYNWGLKRWQEEYAAGGKPSEAAIRRSLNAIKKTEFPWMQEVSKCAPQMAIKHLGAAFSSFFNKTAKYPKPKKKGVHDSFTLSNDHFQVIGKKIRVPHLGWVKLREELRFQGKVLWATFSRQADSWQVSLSVELPDPEVSHASTEAVGLDLGIKQLATLSTGESFAHPNALESKLKRLKRCSRALSRKQRGSKNRQKAKLKLARLHKKIRDTRLDVLHKLTTHVSQRFAVVCLEDLNVCGMVKAKPLARRLSDASFGEIRRQFEYKTTQSGGRVLFVDPFFPSSKLCSCCGAKNESLSLADRQWRCRGCETLHNRDINAAVNIMNQAVSYTVAGDSPAKPVEKRALAPRLARAKRVKLSSTKQELSIDLS